MKEFIQKLVERQDLTRKEASSAMRCILEGRATEAQIGAFLVALKLKGEHARELLGFVEVMREKSLKVNIDDSDAIDLCGTGGDEEGTFNISTVASFVVAGAGATVAKHGNRAISSACGSADVLKALGVNIEVTREKVEACINKIGIGFLFAPLFHPAMKYAAKSRTDLGIKTCFNILGPMTNPGGVGRQLVGTFSQDVAQKIASVFSELGTTKACVVYSHDGLDEVSLGATTVVYEVNGDKSTRSYDVDPSLFELPLTKKAYLRGGPAETNAVIASNVLRGKKGPHRNTVLANAAFALLIAGRAESLPEGVHIAAESIDSGSALRKLNELRDYSSQ